MPTVSKLCQGIPPQQDERYGAAPLVPLVRLSWSCGATAEFYPTALRPAMLRLCWPLRARCPPHQPRARATRVSRSRTAGASPKAPPPRPGAAEADARSGIDEQTLEHGFRPPRGAHARSDAGFHRSGEADAECARRELQRNIPRRMPERELVCQPLRRAAHDRGAVHRLRLPVRAATQQASRLHPRPFEFAFALAHYTFRISIHPTDIILGIGLGDTSRSGPISQSLNCKSSSSDRPKCHDKTYDK